MTFTTDELLDAISRLERGRYIVIGDPEPYSDEDSIDKIVKKSDCADSRSSWHYVICRKKAEGMVIKR